MNNRNPTLFPGPEPGPIVEEERRRPREVRNPVLQWVPDRASARPGKPEMEPIKHIVLY